MDLDDWDRIVAPVLQNIEFNAIWMRHYVRSLTVDCQRLACRPDWHTKAQDELDRAIADTEFALEAMKAARDTYFKKKMEK